MIRGIHKLRKARPSCPVIKAIASHYGIETTIPEEPEEFKNSSSSQINQSDVHIRKHEGVKIMDPNEKWELIEKLGEGGFSQIYKLKNIENPSDLAAAKIIIESEETSEIFRNEFEILKRLKHPNIVTIREAYHFDSYLWVNKLILLSFQ